MTKVSIPLWFDYNASGDEIVDEDGNIVSIPLWFDYNLEELKVEYPILFRLNSTMVRLQL